MKMVRLSLPALEGITRADIVEFYDTHLPAMAPFRVLVDGDTVTIGLPASTAAAANILYYSIPDWKQCGNTTPTQGE